MQNDNESTINNEKPSSADSLSKFLKFKKLLSQILSESVNLRDVILTQNEHEELENAAEKYDDKIQQMLIGTKIHLELYRESGWKDLIYGEKND